MRSSSARRSAARRLKRVIDVALASALLVSLLPVLVLLAVAVRASSPGPVLHRQRRIGLGGRPFEILKFRSMRDQPGGPPCPPPAQGFTPGGPDGVVARTAVGAALRRTSLDELPQLWNILRGDMSLVGPRPERPEYHALFAVEAGWARRHSVRPGLTGLAQVDGLRGAVRVSDRLDADTRYVESWSLWLDLRVLARTGPAVLRDARAGGRPVPASAPAPATVTPLRPSPAPAPGGDREAVA